MLESAMFGLLDSACSGCPFLAGVVWSFSLLFGFCLCCRGFLCRVFVVCCCLPWLLGSALFFDVRGWLRVACALLAPFFLWYGRSRSKARSLHEKKLLLRKLLHGHRWSHAAWQIINQNTNHQKHKARRRSPSQICVSPSKGQQSKQRTGQEPNRNNHKRFAKTQW